ncbi:GNAT family N-acetyltransferase [Microtetraspora fusca]|uniref:GNAT family N-acetyltransferase n=1 Tax=Microtetraspora fusca TaxID=1997 RepID=UPI00082B94B7|nr:GNAT family N-acetyltransferase [Microtetraspora fusca]
MNQDMVLALFDQQMRRDARADNTGARIERADGVVRQVGSGDDWNGVLWSDLDEAGADAAIAAQVRRFTAAGREFEWKLYTHDRPADLPGRLRAAGFAPEPEETVMVAEVADVPTAVELPEGIHLLPVTDAASAELMADVHRSAFGVDRPEIVAGFLARLADAPETAAAVVAMAGDVPVSAARMEISSGTDFAGLWGGGTVPEWRGRGLYRALVAFRARLAAERGCRYLQVDASDQSRPILLRLGFVPLTTTTPYVYRPR